MPNPARLPEVIDPKNLCVAHISPRQRAHKTFHLLVENLEVTPEHVLDDECREWDYGCVMSFIRMR